MILKQNRSNKQQVPSAATSFSLDTPQKLPQRSHSYLLLLALHQNTMHRHPMTLKTRPREMVLLSLQLK